jgi:predicted DNA binding CopG/RHH family protein
MNKRPNNLDDEEKAILSSFENDEWESIATPSLLNKYQKMARNTSKAQQQVSLKLPSKDLIAIQELALKDGIPYQILMASVLHKFVSGQYKEQF